MRFRSSPEEDNEDTELEVSASDTIQKKIKGGVVGRLPTYCIFKELIGPTAYAKRNIMEKKSNSAFLLLIDHHILKHIAICLGL